jgi:nitroreductase
MAAFPEDSFLVGLSSIHWREAWKYGERAFRYCQHDVGHALGTLRFAAAALGWKLFLLDRVDVMSQLLVLNRDANCAGAEREHPELLAVVVRGNWASDRGLCLSKDVASQGAASRWYGTANVLSPEHSSFAAAAAGIAKFLFFLFLVVCLIFFLIGISAGRRVP